MTYPLDLDSIAERIALAQSGGWAIKSAVGKAQVGAINKVIDHDTPALLHRARHLAHSEKPPAKLIDEIVAEHHATNRDTTFYCADGAARVNYPSCACGWSGRDHGRHLLEVALGEQP